MSSVQDALETDKPSLLPTVMAAYAMESFLTGDVFVVIGTLRYELLIHYSRSTRLVTA